MGDPDYFWRPLKRFYAGNDVVTVGLKKINLVTWEVGV